MLSDMGLGQIQIVIGTTQTVASNTARHLEPYLQLGQELSIPH